MRTITLMMAAAAAMVASAETRIASSEVKLNERLSRAEATVKVEGWTPGEQVRIRLCVDRDARSTPVNGDGTYVLATPLRNPKGFAAKEAQFAPSVTLVKDDLRRYDEGTDPLDRARLHFLAPNGPAKPADAYEKSKDYGFPVHQYPTYTGKPEWVMPVGAGELSAMVSFGTNEWHLNLSKTDYFISTTMKPAYKEAYRPDMCSPGHVVIRFDDLKPSDITAFDQAMDVKRGRITLKVATKSGAIEAELWGDRATGALVGSVADGRKVRSKGVYVEIANGHKNPGKLVHAPGSLVSRYGRLQVLEDSDTEYRLVPRWGRYYATELALIDAQEPGVDLPKDLPDGTAAFVVRKTSAPWRFAIKSAVSGNSAAAKDEVASALAALREQAPEELTAARDAWWADFWAQSRIEVTGDARAAFIERLWYQQLYVWAGVGFGKVPPKFNGGAGLVLGDSRSWGAGVWTQNTRELCWPLGAANHRAFMENFVRFYESCRGSLEAKTRLRGLGIGGFQMAETIASADSPFLVATTNAASADVTRPYVPMTAEQTKAWRELRAKKQGMGQILSSGTEILQQMVDYVRYYGDEAFVPAVAAWLRAQTEMYLGATEKGADGKWHVYDTFENESWACPEDCLVDVCAARFCFGMTAKLGAGFGYPANLVAAAKERFENFADLPTGEVFEMDNSNVSSKSAKFVPGDRLYVPFRNPPIGQGKSNVENNELYAVYPFAMGDYAKNVATFRQGSDMVIYGWEPVGAGWGWYPVPMWAARLALPDAADFVYQFAVGNNTWPFGGGRSPASIMYKGAEVEDCPYLDSAGVLQAATQELFLQSHAAEPDAQLFTGGPIRLLPGVPKQWSGSFKLLARGGFLVECAFEKGVVTKCTALSTRGGTCAYVDPLSGKTMRVATSPGEFVVLKAGANAAWPVRAVQLDLARQMETVDFIKRYLAFAKESGYNTVQLYLEGRVRTKSFPFRPEAETYSPEQMREIVAEAGRLGLDLVPVVSVLGHAENFVNCRELDAVCEESRAGGRGRFGKGVLKQTFCHAVPRTREFLGRYLVEMMEIFPGKNFHVGLDESFNTGFCPDCAAKMKTIGLGGLYMDVIKWAHGVLAAHGRRMWMWDDFFEFFPEKVEDLPKDVMLCDWEYSSDISRNRGHYGCFGDRYRKDWMRLFRAKGLDALACPSQSKRPMTRYCDWSESCGQPGGIFVQWEMSTYFHAKLMTLARATGYRWSRGLAALSYDEAVEESVRSLYPSLDAAGRQAVRALVEGASGASAELALRTLGWAGRIPREVPADPFGEAGLIDDLAVVARQGLVARALADAEYEMTGLYRTPEKIRAAKRRVRALLPECERLRERRLAQERTWRPKCAPGGLAAAAKGLVAKAERLLKTEESAAASDEWQLELSLVLPDFHGIPMWTVEGRFGGEWVKLGDGRWKPDSGEWCYFERTVSFRDSRVPDRLRVTYRGYNDAGLAFLALASSRHGRLVPDRVLSVSGRVRDAENVLEDTVDAAVLGNPNCRAAMLNPALADEVSTLEVSLKGEFR